MMAQIRSVAGPVLSVLLAFWGFSAAADRQLRPVKGRAVLEVRSSSADWTSPRSYDGHSDVVRNRTASPKLRLALPMSDAYHVRLFYKLEGKAAGEVRLGGAASVRLEPGRWRKATVRTSFVPKGKSATLVFLVPGGGKLALRRVDYRNYLARVGASVLLKPRGGSSGSASQVQLGLFLFALVLLGAWVSHAGGGGRLARSVWMGGGGAGALLLLQQWFSPYPIHALPVVVGFFILLVAGWGTLVHLTGGKRVFFYRVGLAAGGVLFALVLAEGILWVWDPPISRPRVSSYETYSPVYGWRNRPGARGWQVDIGYHIRINRFGHRGEEYPEKKPAGVFRVLGLGDSFGFGWGVAEKDTFFRVLERKLRETGHRVEVLNASVTAWHSSQSLEYLVREGLRFEPDLVVAEFFMDDAFYDTVDKIKRGEKARDLQAEEASVRRRKKRKVTRLKFYNLWFNYRKILRASREQKRRNPYPSFEAEREKVLSASYYRDFEKHPAVVKGLDKMIRQWREVSEKYKVPVIFTFIPAGGALGFPELQGQPRALWRAVLAHGLLYMDAVAALERQPDRRELYLLPRDGHMSALGHHAVGEALADFIVKGGWLKAKRPRT